ncbi:MAG: aminotransferase class V-fold PLP-dependent enzyme, partial [Sphingomonadales bacterium]|nr:aminotransferase class V-fold PLP-dependent enzyme [Sphingomonadales bacterium]
MTTAQRIYLDNAATTPMAEEVIDAMIPMMREHFGNPSSTHAHGRKVRGIIEESRGTVAKLLNCAPGEIFFTSGGTEADNLALRGSVAKLGIQNIISSTIEHHAVLHTVEELHHHHGVGLNFVNLNAQGHVDMEHLSELLQQKPHALVSLMHANNEIGNMIDVQAVGEMVHQANGIFHCDTVQTMGHFPFDLSQGHIDFLA